MGIHMIREIERLKKQILSLSALVEERLRLAVKSVEERDADLATKVIVKDSDIDEKEIDVEEDCLKILALHQPVASDLRFIISVLKINNDLERIGDKAVTIANRAILLSQKPKPSVDVDFVKMGDAAQAMLAKSLDALVHLDAAKAREVCADDDLIDQMNRDVYEAVRVGMTRDSSKENISVLIHLLFVSRGLERVGDHATNIAEDIIYLVEGHIVRHHLKGGKDEPVALCPT